jgi:hypothetical protein
MNWALIFSAWPVVVVAAGALLTAGYYRRRFEELERRVEKIGEGQTDHLSRQDDYLASLADMVGDLHKHLTGTTQPWQVERDHTGRVVRIGPRPRRPRGGGGGE